MTDSILIFDSGAGGLSVLNEVRQALPGVPLHFLLDSGLFPYGNQDDETLAQRIPDLCADAVESLQPSVLILACNTASTLALPALRARLDIPVVGVVPAIRVAANHCRSANQYSFGLLATPATVRREYTDQLISDFAKGLNVVRFGSPDLVSIAEKYLETKAERYLDTKADRHLAEKTKQLHDREAIERNLFEHLNPWLLQHPECQHVVLGCTHYPLLRPLLEKFWPSIHWVDSGAAVARQAARVFDDHAQAQKLEQNTAHPRPHNNAISIYWTGSERPNGVLRALSPDIAEARHWNS